MYVTVFTNHNVISRTNLRMKLLSLTSMSLFQLPIVKKAELNLMNQPMQHQNLSYQLLLLLPHYHRGREQIEVYSDGSSDSSPSSQDTIETDLSSPSVSSDDRISVDPGPLYDRPQLPGSSVVPPPTDIQHQSSDEESPPPVPLRTEDSEVLVQESSNPSQSSQDKTSTNIQSPSNPTYAEPQLPRRAPVQTPPTEEQALQSPPPVPPRTEDREILLQGSSGSSPTQGSPHIAVSIDLPPSPDPTYAEPQLPAVKQPLSNEKQEVSPKGESCCPTYAQPVLSSGVTCPPPVTEPVVYEDVKGFNNSEVCTCVVFIVFYITNLHLQVYGTCHIV